jgi:hypothetical protein
MDVICPFCAAELESKEKLQDGQKVECPNCQKKFEYFYAVQRRFLEIRENAETEAATELQNLRMREFRRKAAAKAKKHAKEEYYKGSVFPDALRIAIVYGIIAFAASCFMWHDFAMKLVSPGWGWFLLLAGCIIVLAQKVLMIFDPVPDASNHADASKHVDDSKHAPRSIVALSTSILIIAALFVQILAGFAHCPYGLTVLKHRDIYAKYEKALKAEMEKLSEESRRPLELTSRYELESLKEKAKSNLWHRYLYENDKKFLCPKCHDFIDGQKGRFDNEGCYSAKEDYETDLTVLHWMCWLGTGFALLGYVLAYFRRRNDLLR